MTNVRYQSIKVIGQNTKTVNCGSSVIPAGWIDMSECLSRVSFMASLLPDGEYEVRPYRPRGSLRA